MSLLAFAAYIAIFLSAALFAFQLFETEEDRRVRQALNPGAAPRHTGLLLYRLAAPFVVQLAPLLRVLPLHARREQTRKRLIAAGLQAQIEPDELLA
jgi:hypothetical protein